MNEQQRTNEFKDKLNAVHNKHNQSYSLDEGHELSVLCGEYHDIALEWSNTHSLAKFMWEDGDNGILIDILRVNLSITNFLLAYTALNISFGTLDDFLDELQDILYDGHQIYVKYLMDLYVDDRTVFWNEALMMFNEDTEGLFESIIEHI